MPDGSWLKPALIGVALITLARVVLLLGNRSDLFVDEAQYWLWGQEMAFGYYSKPPLIGWVIRAFTEIGTDSPFWIRLPGPLFHGATALILGAVANRLWGSRAGWVTALAYVTLPMVAVASLLISTDTIMFPFLAAALLGYVTLRERHSTAIALLTGVALGLAFMAKYAAVYYLICAGLAAVFVPTSRISLRSILPLLAAFLVTISPNLIWNALNGLTTVQHTLDNADWVRDPSEKANLNIAGLGEFFFAQFAVFGPVLFGTLLAAIATWKRRSGPQRTLILFALPILVTVCIQALLSQAYANWAASAYLAALVLVIAILLRHPRWLAVSFVINAGFCVILPLASLRADSLRVGEALLLERYVGRVAMSEQILATAEAEGLQTIVATDRDILAGLFHTGRDADATLRARPPEGRAPHHYAMRYPYVTGTDDILVVVPAHAGLPCEAAQEIGRIAPEDGAFRRHPQVLYRAPGSCF